MKSFRPRTKFLTAKIKRQIAKSAGVAVLLTLLVAATQFSNSNSNAATFVSPNWNASANTWNASGDWHNCNGAVDNDSAHHSLNMRDADPGHHMGMVCLGTKEAWSPSQTTPSSATVTAQTISSGTVTATPTKTPTTSTTTTYTPPAMTTSIQRAQSTTTTSTVTTSSSSNSNNPFAGAKLYVNAYNDPANYVRNNSGTYNAQLMSKIANQPEVEWLGGWNSNIVGDVTNMMNSINSQGALPVFTVYNIPNRDCGGYSQGGANDSSAYNSWISQIANTIGRRKAVVILEPDAVSLTTCLNASQLTDRYNMLKNAVSAFKSKGNIAVYIDAGHPNWLSASDTASRLKQAGIDQADGFALNIANFITTSDNISYGSQISSMVGGKHFVIDTGRNGSGPAPDNQWCNPSGRSLGNAPTVNTGNPLVDAYLWIKGPGGSDGNCNGGPSAGTFWPDYALGLAQRTNW